MKHLIGFLLFTFTSFSTLWTGTNKLDLWHENTATLYSKVGVGTEFGMNLHDGQNQVSYGYLYGLYNANDHVQLRIGKDYEGADIYGIRVFWSFSK